MDKETLLEKGDMEICAVFLREYYYNNIISAYMEDRKRIIIDIDNLKKFDDKYGTTLYKRLLEGSFESLEILKDAFEIAVNNFDIGINPDIEKYRLKVGFCNHPTPMKVEQIFNMKKLHKKVNRNKCNG